MDGFYTIVARPLVRLVLGPPKSPPGELGGRSRDKYHDGDIRIIGILELKQIEGKLKKVSGGAVVDWDDEWWQG